MHKTPLNLPLHISPAVPAGTTPTPDLSVFVTKPTIGPVPGPVEVLNVPEVTSRCLQPWPRKPSCTAICEVDSSRVSCVRVENEPNVRIALFSCWIPPRPIPTIIQVRLSAPEPTRCPIVCHTPPSGVSFYTLLLKTMKGVAWGAAAPPAQAHTITSFFFCALSCRMPCSAVTLSLATVSAIIAVALTAIAFSTDNWQSIEVKRSRIEVCYVLIYVVMS